MTPNNNDGRTTRNKIDCIVINKRYRNSIKIVVSSYVGADIKCDRNSLVVAKRTLIFKRIITRKRNEDLIYFPTIKNKKKLDPIKQLISQTFKDGDIVKREMKQLEKVLIKL